HATWCLSQTPPSWRNGRSSPRGGTYGSAVGSGPCDCSRNPVARALARMRGEPEPKRPPRAKREQPANVVRLRTGGGPPKGEDTRAALVRCKRELEDARAALKATV